MSWNSARTAGRSSRTAASTRRRFTATMRRSGRYCSEFLAGKSGDVVEAGSGTGQHVVDFARHMPGIIWWPSDLNEQHLKSIAAWRAHAGLPNIRAAAADRSVRSGWCPRDARRQRPRRIAGGVLRQCDPYRAVARRRGPVRRRGALSCGPTDGCFSTGRSSATASTPRSATPCSTPALRERDAEWGVRDIADLERLAASAGLALIEIAEMPANNLILVFGRSKTALNRDAWRAPVCVG